MLNWIIDVALQNRVVVLPPGIERPSLGSVATGLGEVYHDIVSLKGRGARKRQRHCLRSALATQKEGT